MANITPVDTFSDVYQLETTDDVLGGSSGVSNTPLKHLTNRTHYLKLRLDAAGTLGDGVTFAGNLDTLKTAGKFLATNAATNGPIGANYGTVEVINNVANSMTSQLYTAVLNPATYVRTFRSGSWTSWVPFATATALDALASSLVGMVAPFAVNAAPTGWLACSGQSVSRTTYAALFARIGTTFGVGDGSTTFGLPDMRGEFARGWDNGRGVDTSRVFGSFQDHEIDEHDHGMDNAVSLISYTAGVNTARAFANVGPPFSQTSNEGGVETRPRNVALLYCIKT